MWGVVFRRLVVARLAVNIYICIKMRQADEAKSDNNRIAERGFGYGSGCLFPLRSGNYALPALPVFDANGVAVPGVRLATSDSLATAPRHRGGVAI